MAVVVIVDGEVVCVVVSYLMVTVLEAPKPVPVTVTVVPTRPLDGVRVIDGTTVKVSESE